MRTISISEIPEKPESKIDIQNAKLIERYKHSKYDGIFKNVLESNPRTAYGVTYSTKR